MSTPSCSGREGVGAAFSLELLERFPGLGAPQGWERPCRALVPGKVIESGGEACPRCVYLPKRPSGFSCSCSPRSHRRSLDFILPRVVSELARSLFFFNTQQASCPVAAGIRQVEFPDFSPGLGTATCKFHTQGLVWACLFLCN